MTYSTDAENMRRQLRENKMETKDEVEEQQQQG